MPAIKIVVAVNCKYGQVETSKFGDVGNRCAIAEKTVKEPY